MRSNAWLRLGLIIAVSAVRPVFGQTATGSSAGIWIFPGSSFTPLISTDSREAGNDGWKFFCPGTNDAVAFDRQLPHLYNPGDPADIAIRRVLEQKGYSLDLDELPEGARKKDRAWVAAYVKWRTGQRLTISDRQLLVKQVVAGKQLASAKPAAAAQGATASKKAAQRYATVRSGPSSDRALRLPVLAKGPTSPFEGMGCSPLAQGLTYTRSDKNLTLECKIDSEHQPRWQ